MILCQEITPYIQAHVFPIQDMTPGNPRSSLCLVYLLLRSWYTDKPVV